jgi:hypothetical protein
MGEVESIWTAVRVMVASISTLIARYQGTNEDRKWYQRLATTFDLTQIIDGTRNLDD